MGRSSLRWLNSRSHRKSASQSDVMKLGSHVFFGNVILMERLHRLFAAILLLAYVSTSTACFSGLTLLLAELTGSYEVQVSETIGGTCVNFHHSEAESRPEEAEGEQEPSRGLVMTSKAVPSGDHSLSCAHLIGSLNSVSEEIEADSKEPREVEPLYRGGHFGFGDANVSFASSHLRLVNGYLPLPCRSLLTIRLLI